MMNLLTVNGLSKQFGARMALRDVSFTVREGETLGLIGPNGAGKTTLFECLAGLLPTDAGAVSFRGQTLTTVWRKDRRARDATRRLVERQETARLHSGRAGLGQSRAVVEDR